MDIDAALDAHERAATRFAELVRTLPSDPRAVRGSEWSTHEIGAHVLSLFRGYARAATGGPPLWPSPFEGVEGNRRLLDETRERDPRELAAALGPAGDEMRAALRVAGSPIPVFGSVAARPAAILGINTSDTLLHGWDLTRDSGAEWPIADSDAALGFGALTEVLPAFVKPDATDFRAAYGLRLRDHSDWSLTFDAGTLTITPGRPGRADCRISATPTGWMLAGYRRISPVRALLSGQVMAYGRRPWLAPRFSQQFDPP